jgi:hypothetical protein
MRKKIDRSLEELQSVLTDEKTDSTHQEDHDSLKRPIRGLGGLVETRKLRRRVSQMPTGNELGADQSPAECRCKMLMHGIFLRIDLTWSCFYLSSWVGAWCPLGLCLSTRNTVRPCVISSWGSLRSAPCFLTAANHSVTNIILPPIATLKRTRRASHYMILALWTRCDYSEAFSPFSRPFKKAINSRLNASGLSILAA